MLFDVETINELTEQVDVFHLLFVCENIGTEILTSSDRNLLRKHGYRIADLKPETDFLTYSYAIGKLQVEAKTRNQLRQINFKQFKEFVKLNRQRIPVSRAEQTSIRTLKQATYNDIKRLADDIKRDFTHDLIEVSKTQRLKVERIMRRQVKGGDVSTDILTQLKNRLIANTKRWKTRFELISGYRMHEAFQHGISDEIIAKYGINVRVWFSVHFDACEHCKRTYLHGNGTPKIFFLKQVIQNGTNIGRNLKQALPSVSPLHPRCRCKMNVYIHSAKYDKKRNLYVKNIK